jgi:hypothetical protein
MITMRLHHLVLTLLLLGLVPSAAVAIDVPTPPVGYSWKHIIEIDSAFLVPISWHFKETEVKQTLAYFITRENIDTKGSFTTGLTINVLRKGEEFDPVGYAGAFVLNLVKENEVLEEPFEAGGGKLKGYGCRVRVASENGPLVMHYLAIGNENTGTLFLMYFESPESQWEQAWAIAEPILTLFVLGDDS